ncbi:hypothetical protein E4U34_002685 [Claviceps purpurea]|nr:hypothetical protein E4U34_002685 [Claviceps purpurea]
MWTELVVFILRRYEATVFASTLSSDSLATVNRLVLSTPSPKELRVVDHLKHLAAFSKAQQLDSNLALDELRHRSVFVTRLAEKGIDIEHALTNGSSPFPEEGQLGFVSNSSLPVMG